MVCGSPRCWLLLGLGMLALSSGMFTRTLAAPDDEPSRTQAIDQLIQALGSDQFQVREQAAKQLAEHGAKALPALRRAAKSADLEVRLRAEALIEQIRDRLAAESFQEFLSSANEKGIDCFLDELVLRRKHADEPCWQSLAKLSKSLVDMASKASGRSFELPKVDFLKLPASTTAFSRHGYLSNQRLLLDGLTAPSYVNQCMVVSAGPVEIRSYLHTSVLLVNDSIKISNGYIRDSVVFCNGDLEVTDGYIWGSVVIATGNIRVKRYYIKDSVLESRHVSVHSYSNNTIYLNLNKPATRDSREDKLVESKESPLRLLKFFDPASVGFEAKVVDGRIQVQKVAEGNVFARAGLRPGDQVLDIDGTKIETEQSFRKVLRRAIGEGEAVFKIHRGGQMMTIAVTFE
jgi:hypothetical protein